MHPMSPVNPAGGRASRPPASSWSTSCSVPAPTTAPSWARACALVDGLAPGAHTVLVFLDRNDNGALDGCPFPPQLDDAARPDLYENLVGRSDVVIDGPGEVAVTVEVSVDGRVGPGDADTGLTGTLALPETLGAARFLRTPHAVDCG